MQVGKINVTKPLCMMAAKYEREGVEETDVELSPGGKGAFPIAEHEAVLLLVGLQDLKLHGLAQQLVPVHVQARTLHSKPPVDHTNFEAPQLPTTRRRKRFLNTNIKSPQIEHTTNEKHSSAIHVFKCILDV